jgi:threonine dehydrogenase-like Zn-dependent dehydrogenase
MEKVAVLHPDNTTDTTAIKFPTVEPAADASGAHMAALHIAGKSAVKLVHDAPRPAVTDPDDAVVRVTCTALCGTDLHFYHAQMPGMRTGQTPGHEAVGIVESVGPNVGRHQLAPGDRVVVSSLLMCGTCAYCRRGEVNCCDATNPSKEQERILGHRMPGVLGTPVLAGGYPGTQAEYVRVPYAVLNTMKLPPASAAGGLPDELAVLLSDVAPTAWLGVELAAVGEGDTVAIWGAGPVGLMIGLWARFRGAARVIHIDGVPERLRAAADFLGSDVVNFTDGDVVKQLQHLVPGGPDACIGACGGGGLPVYSDRMVRKL